jgi:hypothetical protein
MNALSRKLRKISTLFLPGVTDFGLLAGSLLLRSPAATLRSN